MAMDCSGLVEFWLQQTNPQALDEIYTYINQVRDTDKYTIERMYSFDFYDFFHQLKEHQSVNWQYVDLKKILQAGDILAFINSQTKGRWGHVVVVEQEIERDKDKITLQIIDSSSHQHFRDWHQNWQMGIGRGQIELYQDKNGINKVCYGPDCVRQVAVCAARLNKK